MSTDVSPTGTVVGPSVATRVVFWVVFPLAGAGLGALLRPAAVLLASVPWAKVQEPARLVTGLPVALVVIGGLALGVLAGCVLALVGEHDQVTVTIRPEETTLRRGDTTATVARADVAAVFLADKHLVLLGRGTEELARFAGDPEEKRLAPVFRAYGYPWRDGGDPHRDAYRRWVSELPDLPPGADALFRARGRALRRKDAKDADELRTELARLGLVVHDVDGRQHYRSATPVPAAEDA